MDANKNIPKGKNYDAWKIPRRSREEFMRLSSNDQLRYLCALGHLAPSTHNTQPWRFLIDTAASAIDIYIERTCILPASDPAGREAVISIGASAENIKTGALYYGMRPLVAIEKIKKEEVTTLDGKIGGKKLVRFARISFSVKI